MLAPATEAGAAAAPATLAECIVDCAADALIAVDVRGVITHWNRACEALFGYPRDEAIGVSVDLIIPERLRPAHWAGFRRAIDSGRTRLPGCATLTRARHRSGAAVYVEMTFAVISDADGRALGSVAIARASDKPPRAPGAATDESSR
jgi:PAS domain S-box-containing protein